MTVKLPSSGPYFGNSGKHCREMGMLHAVKMP